MTINEPGENHRKQTRFSIGGIIMLKYEMITRHSEKAKEYFKNKLAFTLGPVELKEIMKNENVQIIDVRKREDYDKGHLPYAISIPANEIHSNLSKLSRDNINVVYCYSQQCHAGAKSALILAENGFPVMELDGGFNAWYKDYDFEVVS